MTEDISNKTSNTSKPNATGHEIPDLPPLDEPSPLQRREKGRETFISTLLWNSGLRQNADWARFVLQCVVLTFIFHLIAAVRSSGFYHADEHFQIIEFMNYKLGRSPATDLPLEYGQLMRPWLLSAIFAGLTTIWRALGVSSPFDWALGYRLCCAGVGFLSTVGLMLSCYRWFPTQEGRPVQWRTYAVLALTLIWYLPALHARHSSENVSGSVFFIALSILALYLPSRSFGAESELPLFLPSTEADPGEYPKGYARPYSVPYTIGLLFGLAFEFRYQTGFMVLGALLWLGLIARIPFGFILRVVGGALIPIALGTLADRWGYGQWTFAPWNYVKYNLVQNHVSDSDVTPWWDYLRRALTESWPPLGLLLLLTFPLAWFRNPKHLLSWSMVPLFLIHEIIGHKELRFLFPLIHAGPVLLLMSIQNLKEGTLKSWKKFMQHLPRSILPWPAFARKMGRWLAGATVAMNGLALVFTTVLPAWNPIYFYEQLYHFNPDGFQLYAKDTTLFDFGGAKMNFYKPPHLALVQVNEYTEVVQALKGSHRPIWLFTPRLEIIDKELRPHCQVEFSALPAWPAWLERLNPLGITSRVTNWTLHRCETPEMLPQAFYLDCVRSISFKS